ncbi:response regulator [Haloarchaeobius sp. DFWS5]|uniref:PAS domain-containing sensor histidine kinase n=1 Tax=Haloarchaeobius sp. DFWS5 TaxID=3446114 RepID=UPI003EBB0F69
MQSGSTGDVRVLHVDDDPSFLDLTKRAVEAASDRVEMCPEPDPKAALDRLDDVDCVVSDYRMSTMDGLELFEAVREQKPDLPFILFTGRGSESIASEGLSAGVDDYLRKDTGTDRFPLLAERIERAVDAVAHERERQEERDRFAALFENIPEPTIAYELRDGPEPYVTDVNPAFEEIFGYDAETVVDERLDEFIVPAELTDEASELNERVQRGEPLDAEVRRLTVDGERQFLLRDVPITPSSGRRYGYAIYTDITPQREREQELQRQRERLERQNERLEAFAGVVSHDLRNPLAVAKTNAQLAIEMDDVTRVENVEDALDRMDELVQDLLTLAQHGVAVQGLDICDVESLAVRAWNAVETPEATLSVEARGAIRCDESRTQQLFENLFRNVIEHGRGATEVRVGFCGDDGFYVADDGVGIPDAEQTDVFDHGFSTSDAGSGFGLAIVESIADAHDWTVSVCESADGGARIDIKGAVVIESN